MCPYKFQILADFLANFDVLQIVIYFPSFGHLGSEIGILESDLKLLNLIIGVRGVKFKITGESNLKLQI